MARYIEAEALKKHFPHDEDWDCPVNTNSLVCELIDAQPAADVVPVAFKGFAEWVASEVCNEDFEDMWSLGAFAEVACRKLYRLCVVEKFNDKWVYVDRKEKDEVKE